MDKPVSLSLCSQVGNVVILVTSACKSVWMISISYIEIDFVTLASHSSSGLFQIQPILKKYDILLVADEVLYLVLIAVLFCSFEP